MSSRRCRRLFTGSLLLLAARRSKQTDLPNCKHIHEREREIERNRNHRQQELTKKEKCFVFSLVLLRPRRRPSAPSSSSSSAAAAALRSRLGLDLVQEGPHLPLQGGGVHRPVGAEERRRLELRARLDACRRARGRARGRGPPAALDPRLEHQLVLGLKSRHVRRYAQRGQRGSGLLRRRLRDGGGSGRRSRGRGLLRRRLPRDQEGVPLRGHREGRRRRGEDDVGCDAPGEDAGGLGRLPRVELGEEGDGAPVRLVDKERKRTRLRGEKTIATIE